MKALDLSKYIIAKHDNAGDLITNKKLQKLMYYIEAWSLVYLSSVVDEDFEAWVHGPVISDMYRAYKSFGYSPIQLTDAMNANSSQFIKQFQQSSGLTSENFELIDEVLKKYGILTSYQLEMLSHSEEPWLSVRKDLSPADHSSAIISKPVIKTYYSSLLA